MARKPRSIKGRGRSLAYSIYVVEVERLTDKCHFDLYVGSTGKSLGARWADYLNCRTDFDDNPSVSSYFRDGHARPLTFRHDLSDRWGPYRTRNQAEWAEGELAYALQQEGFAVYSDRLKFATGVTVRRSAS